MKPSTYRCLFVVTIAVVLGCDSVNRPTSLTLTVPQSTSAQATEALDYRNSVTLYLADGERVIVLDRSSPDMANAKSKLISLRFGPSLRQLIMKAKRATEEQCGLDAQGKSRFTCLLKTLPGADYGTLVKALDEMEACKIYRYALIDSLTPAEETLLEGVYE